jgi:hypothetical protein
MAARGDHRRHDDLGGSRDGQEVDIEHPSPVRVRDLQKCPMALVPALFTMTST